MTQTDQTQIQTQLAVGQFVELTTAPGFYRITGVPEHGKHVELYGGTMHRGGKLMVKHRDVRPATVKPIVNKNTLKRAESFIRAMDEALENAPKPRYGRPGSK